MSSSFQDGITHSLHVFYWTSTLSSSSDTFHQFPFSKDKLSSLDYVQAVITQFPRNAAQEDLLSAGILGHLFEELSVQLRWLSSHHVCPGPKVCKEVALLKT